MAFPRLHSRMADLASRDVLTRLLNRNRLDEQLRRHFASRETPPVTLLQLVVDHFKRVSDEHGHAVGDVVLRAVADALTSHVRGGDFVARVGGVEFVIGCIACIGGDKALYTAKQGGHNRVAVYVLGLARTRAGALGAGLDLFSAWLSPQSTPQTG